MVRAQLGRTACAVPAARDRAPCAPCSAPQRRAPDRQSSCLQGGHLLGRRACRPAATPEGRSRATVAQYRIGSTSNGAGDCMIDLDEPVIRARHLGLRSRHKQLLFSGLSLSVEPGTVTVVHGPPGSGKTSLLDVLAGTVDPSAGSVAWQNGASFARVGHQRTHLDPDATVPAAFASIMESAPFQILCNPDAGDAGMHLTAPLFVGAAHAAWVGTLHDDAPTRGLPSGREIVAALSDGKLLDPALKVSDLSPGERQIVRVAAMLCLLPRVDVLLVDDLTHGMDMRLAKSVREMVALAARTLGVAGTEVYGGVGGLSPDCAGASLVVTCSDSRDASALSEVLESESLAVHAVTLPGPRCDEECRVSAAASAWVLGGQGSAGEFSEEDDSECYAWAANCASGGEEAQIKTEEERQRRPRPVMVDVRDVTARWRGRTIVENLSLRVRRGDTIGIVGRSGAGKSSLLDILGGFWTPREGSVVIPRGARISYVPQHQDPRKEPLLDGKSSPLQYMDFRARHIESDSEAFLDTTDDSDDNVPNLFNGAQARDLLIALGVPPNRLTTPSLRLSGAQRGVLRLAGALASQPDLLLLDEPTPCLDEDGRAMFAQMVSMFPGATLVASHDPLFLRECRCTLYVEIQEGGAVEVSPRMPRWMATSVAGGVNTPDPFARDPKRRAAMFDDPHGPSPLYN